MICHAPGCGITHDETHPTCDCPLVLFDEIIEVIADAIDNQPRSLQKRIGPSEIGNPCNRALIHKLAGHDEAARDRCMPDNYRAWVGTQMHSGFERILRNPKSQPGRYEIEQRVTVGEINGEKITGQCDLFDTLSGSVWDWKTKSTKQLTLARRDIQAGRGPGATYRVQQHLYARGWVNARTPVARVGIIYTPRDGNLKDTFYWSEPYDEQVAVDALQRCTALAQLVDLFGADAALQQYPDPCTGTYCHWCKTSRPPFGGNHPPANNLADLISANK